MAEKSAINFRYPCFLANHVFSRAGQFESVICIKLSRLSYILNASYLTLFLSLYTCHVTNSRHIAHFHYTGSRFHSGHANSIKFCTNVLWTIGFRMSCNNFSVRLTVFELYAYVLPIAALAAILFTKCTLKVPFFI